MFNLIMPALTKFAATTLGKAVITAGAGAVGSVVASRFMKPQESYVNYSRLRASAEAAGFNPLTAIRSGGASGFVTTVPSMSKAGFLASFASSLPSAFADSYYQAPIDKYNEEVRKLTLEDMKTNIKLGKAQLGKLGQNNDPYSGYGEFIPVKYGLKDFKMPTDMAQRMGIKPNAKLATGEIAELFGEGSEFLTNFAGAAQLEMFGTTTMGLASGDRKPTPNGNRGTSPAIKVEPLDMPPLSKGWFEFFIDNGKTAPNPKVPRVFGVIN